MASVQKQMGEAEVERSTLCVPFHCNRIGAAEPTAPPR
jgi:hypothetical protein